MSVWKQPEDFHEAAAESFKKTFMRGSRSLAENLFHESFGVHNGMSLDEYLEYEFDEFSSKKDRFGLSERSPSICRNVGEGFVYFSYGANGDPAVFEGLFKIDRETGRLVGNGYPLKIETKLQFDIKDGIVLMRRRINAMPGTAAKYLVPGVFCSEMAKSASSHSPEFGGEVSSVSYSLENDDGMTFWDFARLSSNGFATTVPIFMKGTDHPLFHGDSFPIVENRIVSIPESCNPTILSVMLENGKEIFFKYPTDKSWSFDEGVAFACVTDSLSNDWRAFRRNGAKP